MQEKAPRLSLKEATVAKYFLIASVALIASIAVAQSPNSPNVVPTGPLAAQMGIDQHYGAQVPLDATFQDETGRTVKFGDMLQGKPTMLLPMFFGCNGVCRLEVEELFGMLEKDKDIQAGKDFNLILLSINPTETPQFASEKKKAILAVYHVNGADTGVHGLVGSMENIRKVTDAIGFRYAYNPTTQQINHPAGMMFLDKTGVVRGYIFGKDYPTVVVANNLKAAAQGVQGEKPQIILLGCVMVDPVTGKRTLIIENLMKVIGTSTALVLGGSILYMTKKYKTPPIPTDYRGGNVPGA
jgi:protein SCO1/2